MPGFINRTVREACPEWRLLFLVLWVLLLWGGNYALRGYWEPDEPRYVYVAQEMADAGEWLVPHRHGLPYAHKPPLMFWLINLGESVFPAPFGSRLPSLLGVLLALWSVHGIGMLWRDRQTARRAVVVLSSAWLFWDTCGRGQIDGLLIGLELAALQNLLKNDRDASGKTPWLAFILMGLAVLAKGPVGLLVPLAVYLTLRFCDKASPHVSFLRLGLGLLVAVAIPVAWIAACWHSGAPAEYLHELLFTQNVSRAAGELGHRNSIFYFVFHAPLAFMPWTLFLPAAWMVLRKSDPALLRRLAGWVLVVIVFFSIPVSKRNIYILLALPGMALGIAAAWSEIEKTRYCRAIALSLLSLIVVLFSGISLALLFKESLGLPWISESASRVIMPLSAWPFLVTLAVAAAGLRFMSACRSQWLAGYAGALCLILACVGAFIFPSLNDVKVPDEIRPLAARYVPAEGRLLLYDLYGESLALHAGRMGMRCDDDEQMSAAMQTQRHGLAVFHKKHAGDLKSRFPLIDQTGEFRMGSKTYVWAAFGATASGPEAESDGS
jgi:4-amino-4-deoxy-L-arabinose transferase-like glycosyltransferase